MQSTNPENFTPDNIVKDLILIADEMNINKFSYYDYSWMALVGLQLAIRRTNKLLMIEKFNINYYSKGDEIGCLLRYVLCHIILIKIHNVS